MAVPSEIHNQKYISLGTFRKTGIAVYTPIWFVEHGERVYFMTSSQLGKYKRIRNNPKVTVAPCTMRGKITGPQFSGTARILGREEGQHARDLINSKYFLARIPFLWRNTDAYVEIKLD